MTEERILYKSFKELIKDNPEFKQDFPSLRVMLDMVLPFYGIIYNTEKIAYPIDPIMGFYDGKAKYFYASHNGGEESLMLAFIGVGIADSGNIQVIKNPVVKLA